MEQRLLSRSCFCLQMVLPALRFFVHFLLGKEPMKSIVAQCDSSCGQRAGERVPEFSGADRLVWPQLRVLGLVSKETLPHLSRSDSITHYIHLLVLPSREHHSSFLLWEDFSVSCDTEFLGGRPLWNWIPPPFVLRVSASVTICRLWFVGLGQQLSNHCKARGRPRLRVPLAPWPTALLPSPVLLPFLLSFPNPRLASCPSPNSLLTCSLSSHFSPGPFSFSPPSWPLLCLAWLCPGPPAPSPESKPCSCTCCCHWLADCCCGFQLWISCLGFSVYVASRGSSFLGLIGSGCSE